MFSLRPREVVENLISIVETELGQVDRQPDRGTRVRRVETDQTQLVDLDRRDLLRSRIFCIGLGAEPLISDAELVKQII